VSAGFRMGLLKRLMWHFCPAQPYGPIANRLNPEELPLMEFTAQLLPTLSGKGWWNTQITESPSPCSKPSQTTYAR
jgi:hypothetical protein